MIKKIITVLFLCFLFFAMPQIPAYTALEKPATVGDALLDANGSLGYEYFEEKNRPSRKSLNSNLAVGNWGSWDNRITGKIYHSDVAADLGYTMVYGSASSFSSGVPDVLGETMGADTFWNFYAPMDAWDASKTFEQRIWILYPWNNSRTISLCRDKSFDSDTPGIGQRYQDNIENGILAFYHNVLGTNWRTPPDPSLTWADYVHVMQPPTANGFGVGRMWHMVSGHLWYLIVPIAPDNYNVVPEMVEEPPEPEVVIPTGMIKFVPDSCTWRNTDLQVRVYVDGNTTATIGGYNSRDYSYKYLSCTLSEHKHHSGCYNADGDLICGITEHTHKASCYSTSHRSMNWSYSQDWGIGQINVSGTPPLAATANITNNTTVTLSRTGVNKLAAKLSGWNAGTKTWSSGSPPQGSWDSDTPADTSAPDEDYASSSGSYHIDKVNPTITFNWSNQDDFKSGQHWFIYEAGNKINLTLGDNLSGIAESRYSWSQDATFPADISSMSNLGRTTTEGAAATVNTAVMVHTSQNRIGSWYLHVYARDRAGNMITATEQIYIECSLQNFRITDITDRQWESVFWNPDYASGISTGAYYPVSTMPVDSHPTKNILTRIGYAFYFSMTSRGLNDDADTVQIKPRFYYMKDLKSDSIRNAYEVDLYYDLDSEYLIQYGSSRDHFAMTYDCFNTGGLSQLILNYDVRTITDSKNSTWNGRFALMPTTKAVRKGLPIVANGKVDQSIILTKGLIMVNFTIEGYKNGVKVFDYNPDQWTAEGGPKDSTLFYTGDTIIFDLSYSSLDDYEAGTDR
jgi:hypothetical protein